ncbi:MAG: hypothetical protein M1834_003405 [Cirrosporium novae-zelandiae]|nr:MAG: hypothetical protein M1834_003405 [Cirrosporium novae-zelandiae]
MYSKNYIPCTFKNCQAKFESLGALQRHKHSAPEHDYCKACDLDFDDEDSLRIHKVQMTDKKHIVCEHCGCDFKSEGGKNRHIKQMHRTGQNIVCKGNNCGKGFVLASSLVKHIESGECPGISPREFERERSQKRLLNSYLGDPGKTSNRMTFIDVETIEEEAAMQSLNANYMEVLQHEPTIPGKECRDMKPEHGGDPNISSNIPHEGSGHQFLTKTSCSEKPFANISVTPNLGAYASSSTIFSDDSQLLSFHSKDPNSNDHHRFMDISISEFLCPHPGCGRSYANSAQFEAHMDSPAHSGNQASCPSCLRKFETVAALFAHCESANTRCRISESDDYSKMVDELSGGYLTATYGPNGEIHYRSTSRESTLQW